MEGDELVAGFAKGDANVQLIEGGNETILKYISKSEVKSKLAQFGSCLILSTVKKYQKLFLKTLEIMFQMIKIIRNEVLK